MLFFVLLVTLLITSVPAFAVEPPEFQREWHVSDAAGGVSVADNELVYVAATSSHWIYVFTPAGVEVDRWSGDGSSFRFPKDVAIRKDGKLFACSPERVYRFGAGGLEHSWWLPYMPHGPNSFATGVGIASDGHVYVVDRGWQYVFKYDEEGVMRQSWRVDDESLPAGVALGDGGEVYVSMRGSNLVIQYDATGAFVRQWGGLGTGDGQFDDPSAIEVDTHGNVLVVDTNNHRIQVFDSTGQFLYAWGHEGNLPGEFSSPHGIAVGADGTIYVTDSGNSRVQVFAHTPTHVTPASWSSIKQRYK